jgi:two-component system, NarL family, sensor histidine kinase UhpB
MNKRLTKLLRGAQPTETPTLTPLDASASSATAPGAAGAAGSDEDAGSVGESELERLKKRLRELAGELVGASEAARIHLARELHDGVGPELTAARLALASMEPALSSAESWPAPGAFALARRSLDAASEATRRIVADLHGPQLDGGIVGALSQWTLTFTERTGLRTSLVCAADIRLTQLPQGAALAVFRVAQEALANVARHASASCADIRVKSDARHLTLIVADDGRGMPRRPRKTGRTPPTGFGLPGMRARCEALGGSLRILARRAPKGNPAQARAGATGCGTTVRARFAWDAMLGGEPADLRTVRTTACGPARDAASAK